MPKCDFCDDEALYDARIPLYGCWGYVCELHKQMFECKHYTKLEVSKDDQAVQTVRRD